MKALQSLFGDYRLWLIAGLCVLALANLVVKMPLIEKHEVSPNTNFDWSLFAKPSPTKLDFVLFYGMKVNLVRSMLVGADPAVRDQFAEPSVHKFRTFTPLAMVVMALCGWLAMVWTKSRWSAWTWMLRFGAVALLMYPHAVQTCLAPYDPSGQWTISVGAVPSYTAITFAVSCLVAGLGANALSLIIPVSVSRKRMVSVVASEDTVPISTGSPLQGGHHVGI